MYLTLDENQRMARAAEADSMNGQRRSPPSERRRISLNGNFSGSASRQAPQSRPNPTSLSNIVYWPSHAVSDEEGLDCLDARSMTHLIYTAATVDHDGTFRLNDESPNFGTDPSSHQSSLEACVALKNRNPDLQIIVSVGGGAGASHSLSYVAGNERLSRSFGKAARSFAARYEVDGIELDWSSASNEEEAERFLKLTATTEGYLGPDYTGRSFRLCIALPGTGPLIHTVNFREANKLVDMINVKTFDFPGSPVDRSGHQAQTYDPRKMSCVNVIQTLQVRGANLRKVILGVPCFGRAYLGASAPSQPFNEMVQVPYKELPLGGTHEYVDNQQGAAYCAGMADVAPEGSTQIFVSYDCPASVGFKVQLVRDKGLGGLCFWHGAWDKVREGSLITAGFVGLKTQVSIQ